MFNKDEAKKIRQEFWISFGKSFPRKWILYHTGIKDFSLKFHFDLKSAMVSMDIESPYLEKRLEIWEKLISLQSILLEEYLPNAIYEDTVYLNGSKEISRISVVLDQVSIHNKKTWQETMVFLKETMQQFEKFFTDYEVILKP